MMNHRYPKIVILLGTALAFISLYSCKPSNEKSLISNSATDSLVCRKALKKANDFLQTDCDSFLFYWHQALNTSQKVKNVDAELNCYARLIQAQYMCANDSSSFWINNYLGNAQRKIALDNNWKAYAYKIYNLRATNFYLSKEHDSATTYYLLSLQHKVGDEVYAQRVYPVLAQLYAESRDFENAIKYLKLGLSSSTVAQNKMLSALHLIELARIGLLINDSTLIRGTAMQLNVMIGKDTQDFIAERAAIAYFMGTYFVRNQQLDSGAYFLNKSALELLEVDEDGLHLNGFSKQMLNISLANLYFEQKDYSKSKKLLFAVGDINENTLPYDDDKLAYYRILYKLGKIEGNDRIALSAIEKAKTINEKIINSDNRLKLLGYEKDLKKAAAQSTIDHHLNVINKQKNELLFGAIILLLLIFGIITFSLLILKSRKAEKQKHLLDLQYVQMEERGRIAQEMHDDLGSTLTTISMGVNLVRADHENERALMMIEDSAAELHQLMNEIVWSLNQRNDNLQSLSSYIRHFFSKFYAHLNIEFEWTEEHISDTITVDGFKRRAIYLAAKELANNIAKHAQATKVAVNFKYEDGSILFTIKDNGLGMSQETSKALAGHGNGILNIKNTIQALNGIIDWVSGEGTTVNISVPN